MQQHDCNDDLGDWQPIFKDWSLRTCVQWSDNNWPSALGATGVWKGFLPWTFLSIGPERKEVTWMKTNRSSGNGTNEGSTKTRGSRGWRQGCMFQKGEISTVTTAHDGKTLTFRIGDALNASACTLGRFAGGGWCSPSSDPMKTRHWEQAVEQ